jgi:hypothetical protein
MTIVPAATASMNCCTVNRTRGTRIIDASRFDVHLLFKVFLTARPSSREVDVDQDPHAARVHAHLFLISCIPSNTKLSKPMANNSTGKPSRKLRLSQVGQVPHNLWTAGLSAPPTIPRVSPQSLMPPIIVNNTPAAAIGSQSLKMTMATSHLSLNARPCACSSVATRFPPL